MLLACLGWSGEHLHVFEIRGRQYADCAFVDARSSRSVSLESIGLRVGERFRWRYEFCSDWVIDLRVEALVDVDGPAVVSGRRAGPPEVGRGHARVLGMGGLSQPHRHHRSTRSGVRRRARRRRHVGDRLGVAAGVARTEPFRSNGGEPGIVGVARTLVDVGGSVMRVIVQVRIHHDDDEPDGDGELIDIAEIDRTDLAASTTGLSIDEAKQILAGVQDTVVTEHAAEVLAARAHCDRCGRRFASKDSRAITMGTLYGSHRIGSPRWWTCPCSGPRRTFSPLTELLAERVTPELALVEAKLAAHMSYQAACGLLGELFPVGRRLHRSEMLRTVARLADRFDTELAADEVSYRDRHDLDDTTPPGMPIVVTIDGGYGHSAEQTSRRDGWFQAVCGTVTTHAGETRRFGFVPNVDPTPRSRIRGVLETQGLRQDQLVTFLTDGADDLAGFCEHMNHTAEHVLDWFHIAMRFTIISNTVTNVAWTASLDDCEENQPWARRIGPTRFWRG